MKINKVQTIKLVNNYKHKVKKFIKVCNIFNKLIITNKNKSIINWDLYKYFNLF